MSFYLPLSIGILNMWFYPFFVNSSGVKGHQKSTIFILFYFCHYFAIFFPLFMKFDTYCRCLSTYPTLSRWQYVTTIFIVLYRERATIKWNYFTTNPFYFSQCWWNSVQKMLFNKPHTMARIWREKSSILPQSGECTVIVTYNANNHTHKRHANMHTYVHTRIHTHIITYLSMANESPYGLWLVNHPNQRHIIFNHSIRNFPSAAAKWQPTVDKAFQ